MKHCFWLKFGLNDRFRIRGILLSTLLAVLAVNVVLGQQDRGTFDGIVTDSSGALLPGVKVVVVNKATSGSYDSITNDSGQYRIPNLPVGTYALTFQQAGFKNVVRDSVRLSVADVVRIDVTLEVGAIIDSIQVHGQPPLPPEKIGRASCRESVEI